MSNPTCTCACHTPTRDQLEERFYIDISEGAEPHGIRGELQRLKRKCSYGDDYNDALYNELVYKSKVVRAHFEKLWKQASEARRDTSAVAVRPSPGPRSRASDRGLARLRGQRMAWD